MKNYDCCERIVARLFDPKVIENLELIPRGYKSMIIESALSEYFKSDNGHKLIDRLQHRKNKKQIVLQPPACPPNGVFKQLKGDF
jgi:hypothetical protein